MLSPAVALLITICFLSLATWYLGRRLIAPLKLKRALHLLAWMALALVVGSGFSAPALMGLAREGELNPADVRVFQHFAYIVLGFVSFLFTVVVLEDLLILARKFLVWVAFRLKKESTAAFLSRHFGWFRSHAHGARLGRASVVLIALLLTALGSWNANSPQVVSTEIPIAGLPLEFEGYRIAVLSDIHIGPGYGREFVQQLVRQVNSLDADVVLLVGDVADGLPGDLIHDYEPLRSLQTRDGKLYVTGNHEYYWDAPGWMEAMRSVGFQVLHNSHVGIRRGMALLAFGGVPDVQGERFFSSHRIDLDATFSDVDGQSNLTRILLAHQPKVAAQLLPQHAVALQISGHTHGGQFFPWTLVVGLVQRWAEGLYPIPSGWIYVGRGAGAWGPPIRLGASPEISLLTLHAH